VTGRKGEKEKGRKGERKIEIPLPGEPAPQQRGARGELNGVQRYNGTTVQRYKGATV